MTDGLRGGIATLGGETVGLAGVGDIAGGGSYIRRRRATVLAASGCLVASVWAGVRSRNASSMLSSACAIVPW